MSVASTSRLVFNATIKKQLKTSSSPLLANFPAISSAGRRAAARSYLTFTSGKTGNSLDFLSSRGISGKARFTTSIRAQAQQLDNIKSHTSPKSSSEEDSAEWESDEPPKKAGFRERLRFLSRRYGWWALAVYLLASLVDFSLVFGAIHMLGADHIRDLEDRFRSYIGVGKRELADHETAAWPVPVGMAVSSEANDKLHVNNAEAARLAVKRVELQEDVKPISGKTASSSSSSSSSNGTLWTEAVLAYTIHKTLLLPFRVGVTAAITPSFVKYMVKLGWAKDNAAVRKAADKVKMAREAAKSATASTATKAKTATSKTS